MRRHSITRSARTWGCAAALAAVALSLAPADAWALPSQCFPSGATVTCSYYYDGAEQVFPVPDGVGQIKVEAIGAPGQYAGQYGGLFDGAAAGYATATLAVTGGSSLYVEVGGRAVGTAGGWNGGGSGGSGASTFIGPGGGGASDLRTISCGSTCATGGSGASLESRLLVAGGGGSDGAPGKSSTQQRLLEGAGGSPGTDGTAGQADDVGDTGGGGGATAITTAGGAAGVSGIGAFAGLAGGAGSLGVGGSAGTGAGAGGGGGGGGYYGGGGGGAGAQSQVSNVYASGGGGGGGSSYVPAGGTIGTDSGADPEVIITYIAPPAIDATASATGTTAATAALSAPTADDLLVAFVSTGSSSKAGNTVSVSGSGLTWTRVGQENSALGDSEVWMAQASGTVSNAPITATEIGRAGYSAAITVIAFSGATGIGASGEFYSDQGAPTGTISTTQGASWVFAVGNIPAKAASPTDGLGQTIQHETASGRNAFWVQSTTAPTSTAGPVTINDTSPATDPYNLVLVEVL